MAQINIKVKSEFAQASKDLKNFGSVTAAEAKRVESYLKTFKADKVNTFIDANRRLGAAYKANKGVTASIIAQQKALERQSISLIKKGLDPESDSVQQLSDEYNRLQKEYDETTVKTKDQTKASKLASGAMLALGASAVVLGGRALEAVKDFSKESINAASAAEEANAKFNTAFGGIENKAAETALELKKSYGLSQVESEKLLGSTGDLLKGFGATATSALDFSKEIQELSVDIASYNDLQGGAARASRIVTKAVLGNKDGLIELGVSLLDVDIKQELVRRGQENLTGQAGKLAKAQATYALILQQTGDAQGDFARTQDSYANSMKVAKARTSDLQVELGRALLPTATKGIGIFSELTGKLGDYIKHLNDVKIAEEAQASGVATKQQELTILKDRLDVEQSNLKNQKLSMQATDERLAQAGIVQTQEQKNNSLLGQNIAQREIQVSAIGKQIGLIETQINTENELAEANRKTEESEIEKAVASETAATAAIKLKELNIDSINKIIDAHLSEKEVIDNKIISLQEITGLTESENQKRLESIKLLQKDKQTIIDDDIESSEKAESEKAMKALEINAKFSEDKLAILEAQKADAIEQAESVGADTTLIHRFYENEKAKISKDASDKKKADSLKAFEDEVNLYAERAEGALNFANNIFDIQSNLVEAEKNLKLEQLNEETAQATALKAFKDKISKEDLERSITQTKKEIANLEALGDADSIEKAAELQRNLDNAAALKILEAAAVTEAAANADAVLAIKKEQANKQWEIDKKAAIANKALALIDIAVNTAVGISKALAQGGILGIAAGVAIGAAGIAQGVAVATTPAPPQPTFQTGTPMGGFEVPQNTGSSRADNTSVAVSPNENISVTPRGESGQGLSVNVGLNGDTLISFFNDKIESGDIRITTDNIQSA